ncbi:ECF-family RNA polymerase sigma factor [gamma proteobacterium HdN1]|nr:ECF-family RNA polymerase sigma factor [gamma proteobacterium HdN1]
MQLPRSQLATPNEAESPQLPQASASQISERSPESELISVAATGHEGAFEIIMQRYNRRIFRTTRAILKDDAEAEDAAQEAWLKAWVGLAEFRAEAKLSTWLTRIAVNEALGRLRKKSAVILPLEPRSARQEASNAQHLGAGVHSQLERQLERQPDRHPDHHPEHSAMRTELRQLMEARIDELPDKFRTVFMLRAVEEMSVEEVAIALDIPEATVRTRFFRARALLRETLAREMDMALEDAFAFGGERCNRIARGVLKRAREAGFFKPIKPNS